MKHFVGIDLGTTNSAICSYDGENIRVYKSPEQNSVTPSAIYIDRRSRYYGQRAYDFEARSPDNVAVRFKRLIGTNTPIRIPAVKLTMTPEECSAEILRVLFGYLNEKYCLFYSNIVSKFKKKILKSRLILKLLINTLQKIKFICTN